MKHSITHNELLKHRAINNESNDCAVRAVTAATHNDYTRVLFLMHKHGRKPRDCTYWNTTTKPVLNELGYQLEENLAGLTRLEETRNARLSIGTLQRYKLFSKGIYLIHTRNHISCMIDGELIDAIRAKRKVVRAIHRVLPISKTND